MESRLFIKVGILQGCPSSGRHRETAFVKNRKVIICCVCQAPKGPISNANRVAPGPASSRGSWNDVGRTEPHAAPWLLPVPPEEMTCEPSPPALTGRKGR